MYLRILNKIKSKLPLIGIIVILVATAFLRLYNLGYSDYIKDEHRTFYDSRYAGTFWEFALDQRKGPMQYLVAFVPKMFAGNFSNEYAQRLPFALFNIVSVYIFYLLVKRFTGDERVGLTASGLYAVNGFISGFGRIAQYQNLNLLFSFLALYFFYDMAFKVINNIRNAILGILFLVFSSLSHWDAIFIVVPVMYLWAVFLRSRLLSSRTKVMSIISTTLIFLAMILPFLVPYTQSQLSNAGNQSYLDRRVGLFQGRDLEFDFLIKLYNPFITYYLYIFLGLLGAIFIKRSWVFILWFLVDYLLFYFFAAKPGTHVYNFLIPVFILCAVGFWSYYDRLARDKYKGIQHCRFALLAVLVLVESFMYYQSYRLFVESNDEYPWEDEKILFLTAERYYGEKVLPLFGFPHYRAWKQIGQYIAEANAKNATAYTYDTNEDSSNISFYTGVDKSNSQGGYYYIGVKRPISFVLDWKPKQIKNKTAVKDFKTNGEVVSILYVVKPKVI